MIKTREKYKDKLSVLSPVHQNELLSAIASFEIEGIVITEEMIANAIRIINGEITGKELNDQYIKSLKIKKENE